MTNVVKAAMKKTREKMAQTIIDRLNEVESQLSGKIEAVENNLHSTQLDMNHRHSLALSEIEKRVKNSGIITLSDQEIIVKIFSGLKMYLDPRDLAITPHLALDGIWEHRQTAAWLRVVKPHDTVIEIGSNNGYYGALAAQLTDKKKSKVVMFEANPKLIPYIKRTLAVNWLNEQCVLENMAVGDKDGQLTLHVLKDYVGSSSVHSNEHVAKYMGNKMYLETAEEVTVPATSLDNYCRKHKIPSVDLILMDIEGFEDTAYAGMRKTVAASPNVTLFIEFTKDAYDQPKKFYDELLKDFGNVYIIDDDGNILKPKDSSYEAIIGDADDWVMPIFSKNPKLANK